MKNIIKFIINQEHETIDKYPSLAEPISKEFGIELELAEDIVNAVIEWEISEDDVDSLEEFLKKKFPDIVTI